MGLESALERASACADAGADALLVHARSFSCIEGFASAWRRRLPLIVVPTLFESVSIADLERRGFSLVIYPNHAARAAIRAIRDVMARILRTGHAQGLDDDMVPLSEIYRLVRLERLDAAERRFLDMERSDASMFSGRGK
jgi:phosphoenolpyruvate phosphomutase